jgi:hypothetical protein
MNNLTLLKVLKSLMFKYMQSDYELTKDDYTDIVSAVHLLESRIVQNTNNYTCPDCRSSNLARNYVTSILTCLDCGKQYKKLI